MQIVTTILLFCFIGMKVCYPITNTTDEQTPSRQMMGERRCAAPTGRGGHCRMEAACGTLNYSLPIGKCMGMVQGMNTPMDVICCPKNRNDGIVPPKYIGKIGKLIIEPLMTNLIDSFSYVQLAATVLTQDPIESSVAGMQTHIHGHGQRLFTEDFSSKVRYFGFSTVVLPL